ncbi:MAG: IS110 family transposase [Gammaproteobacteria bacterium]|nr:IS110 family transposase [Gammaproteobacteria bacterium]
MKSLDHFAAIIGIDWADRKHDLCLRCRGSAALAYSVLSHSPQAIDDWARELQQRFPDQQIAICIESRKVPLIHALLKYPFLVLFPVNPQTLARYRRAFRPSRAKDDPVDAQLLLDLVSRHPEQFNPWTPERPEIRALASLVEQRRTLVADKVRYTNRLTSALKNYYPQALDWFDDKDTLLFCNFVERWPNLAAVKRARHDTLQRFFHQHGVRRSAVIERRIASIKTAIPLTTDPAVIEPQQLLVMSLIHRLALTLGYLAEYDREIDRRFTALDDAKLFTALPGAGQQLAPRLLVAFGEDRQRFNSAESLCRYAGIAPVTERSGNKSWVHWRYSCPRFLRQTFVEWANESIRFSFWARAFYQLQRERGKTHQMAVRSLAFKWVRILFRCWQTSTPYDEAKYLMALKAKGSPLVAELAK